MTEAAVPSVVAMLLCDNVITDAETKKKVLIGVFDRLNAAHFPAAAAGFWVYARLTDAEGKYVFRLRFVFLDEDKPVAEARSNELAATDRLAFLELTFHVPVLPLEKPGRYEIQLYANDVYIGRTTMSVVATSGG